MQRRERSWIVRAGLSRRKQSWWTKQSRWKPNAYASERQKSYKPGIGSYLEKRHARRIRRIYFAGSPGACRRTPKVGGANERESEHESWRTKQRCVCARPASSGSGTVRWDSKLRRLAMRGFAYFVRRNSGRLDLPTEHDTSSAGVAEEHPCCRSESFFRCLLWRARRAFMDVREPLL
jgi:hypothetical protein